MALFEAIVVFVVGHVSGTVTRWFTPLAIVAALVLATFGLAAPPSFFAVADPVLEFYSGNELLFLAGFLFAIGSARPETECGLTGTAWPITSVRSPL